MSNSQAAAKITVNLALQAYAFLTTLQRMGGEVYVRQEPDGGSTSHANTTAFTPATTSPDADSQPDHPVAENRPPSLVRLQTWVSTSAR